MQQLIMTRHANRRARQRGMRHVQIEQLFLLSDLASQVDRHLCAFRVSREALREAVADGLPPSEAERLAGRALLLTDSGTVVTLAHLHGGKAQMYRRRDRRPYWKTTRS
ncbi:hypothetical protein [Sphingomonas prati]|uniref:DUF4258 domain-containing protein n=1 Tax=Sphingomonas prati TaxID=1843237 RepID=A0A7W9BUZ0_9SPHN|nr:hypothetical protein [Sphingomonas prati]MBB5730612.1 hypothetical protein [Sphingomonas prati]